MPDRRGIGKTVPSTTERSGGSASVLWGLAHLPGRADPRRLLPTLWDVKPERLAWLTERAPVRLPLPFRSIHYALMRLWKRSWVLSLSGWDLEINRLNINQSLKVKSPIPIKRLASVEVEPVVEVW